MEFETELRGLLRQAVDRTEVDIHTLTTMGVARGTHRVWRRRVTQLAVVGATLAVVGTAAHSLPGTTASDAGPARAPSGRQQPVARTVDITPQAALRLLLDLLPAGSTTEAYQGGDAKRGLGISPAVDVGLSYIDAAGASNVSLRAGRLPSYVCPPQDAENACTATTLADGSVLTVHRLTGPDNAIRWSVNLDRTDDMHVFVAVDNARADHGPGTRPTPALSVTQLKAIVQDSGWQLRVDKRLADKAEPLFTPRPPSPHH